MTQKITDAEALKVRPMHGAESQAVAAILQYYASQEILLWRTPEDILEHKESFHVAVLSDEVVGCVALQDYGRGLYELRSLAVKKGCQGKGIGSELVRYLVDEARRINARELFALTGKVRFFQHLGFRLEQRDNFPQKVWRDCQNCRKRDCCDETAVAVQFE